MTCSLTIADCGSGWTRVEHFSIDALGVLSVESSKLGGGVPPLDEVLSTTKSAGMHAFIRTMRDELEGGRRVPSSAPLVVGCTAGVRSALAAGRITPQRMAEFSDLVRALAQPRGSDPACCSSAAVEVIDGEREAALERHAAVYCARRGCPAVAERGSAIIQRIGLLSSGGMSSQLVLPRVSSSPLILSLDTKLKREGNAAVLAHGASGVDRYAAFLRDVALVPLAAAVAAAVPAASPSCRELEGTASGATQHGAAAAPAASPPLGHNALVVAIEMMGAAGERAGLGGRLVLRDEALAAFEATRAAWLVAARAASDEERAAWDWRNAVHGTMATQAIAVLSTLDPSYEFLFARKFTVGEAGAELKPSWSLGLACERVGVF